MSKKLYGCLVVLCLAAVVSGGCAKKDVVKPEEQTPATQVVPPPAPLSEGAKSTPAQTAQPVAETPAKEQAVAQETPQQGAAAQPAATALESALQKIYFNFDSADLSNEARSALSKNAELLAKQPGVSIRVEGNCDERGSDEYNLALGERRAKAARDYLVNLGVKPERISVISYGEEKPVDQGHDEAAWAKNRRDEFVIVK
ncbi:peptidoglycan-associated lipoprotein [Geomonas limicola]|uniref:Peptidoglycan-associated lipoprotein n=1 Tax=Geomonas limicola TaxID=2740186 RepID=A0A6V8N8B2_9BACT|nr:peptidoglycan-associated lipoprotein Pal [Geomonas limicola]GFO68806.1 peptidoglycan-associated lipoprotein [Geomonas limicola]